MRYARNTEVSTERSEAEIKRILQRYGAWEIMSLWRADGVAIQFSFRDRAIRFSLPLPDRKADAFCLTPTGKMRNINAAHDAWERACRQRWRALKLVIQAKLEAVESDITTFDDEFLAHIVMPNGHTIGEAIVPSLSKIANAKQVAGLLAEPKGVNRDER